MSKEAVLSLLETDMDDPGSEDAGYLREHVIEHSRSVLEQDRLGLVQALHEWLESRSQPRTFLAVRVIEELQLVELRDEILKIGRELESRVLFPEAPNAARKLYLQDIARALAAMEKATM